MGRNLVLKVIEHESQDEEIGKKKKKGYLRRGGDEVIRIYQQSSMEGGKLSPQFTRIAF